jgi:hypothetical protein
VIILYVLAELDSAKVDMPLITTNRQMKWTDISQKEEYKWLISTWRNV